MDVYQIRTNDFNLDFTLSCGQVFRWDKNDWWIGVVAGEVIRAKQVGNELLIDAVHDKDFIIDYFRLNDDMERIYSEINRDKIMEGLINKYHGLRLIRQDPWECLISYICSSNNTIRNIRNSIRLMCECFGREIEKGLYTFPSPEALAEIEPCDIVQCRMGFRTPNVLEITGMIAKGEFDLYGIKDLSYEEGRKELVKIRGVGNKIADCVLLFAFGKLESFPVDTHIEQIMDRFYANHFKEAKKSKKREDIAGFARGYFGRYCGYAQEYLYLEDLG
ncbi:MAG: DNA glycosylase [Candidatus Methanoperedens sp.]|nr:DNA glycosylase [Candidatus Methanoperedens sp.]